MDYQGFDPYQELEALQNQMLSNSAPEDTFAEFFSAVKRAQTYIRMHGQFQDILTLLEKVKSDISQIYFPTVLTNLCRLRRQWHFPHFAVTSYFGVKFMHGRQTCS